MQLAPQQYDLILLDTVLDAMDGLQLLQVIKHQTPASKFIIVSDSGDETSRAVEGNWVGEVGRLSFSSSLAATHLPDDSGA